MLSSENLSQPHSMKGEEMADVSLPSSEKSKVEVRPHPLLASRRAILPDDDALAKECPTLWSLLMPTFDEKGKLTREGSSVSVRVDGSLYRATVSCPTEGYQGSVTTNRLLMLWSDIEQVVNLPEFNWVQDYDSLKKAKQRLKEMLSS